ncbi:expressed unknown protein [Ectocarpus siliculosus]|uniref:Uncharacterized protein n=1 Tax=Ectocarpus siliculosus TaxID=2880 RepID=D8LE75_ECTSI|nr:expressed unknown protein [Ectocarpus siliculosus]|eukprot:CBN74149.1 expressed unknown protein [Ectocarpus siliculosus]
MLQRSLGAETDSKVYEKNLHDTMAEFPELRKQRKIDYYRVFKLMDEKDNARERRRKVFEYFNGAISRQNNFQTGEIYEVSRELLMLVDEFRELLDRLFSWCDLCLPGNDQAFAESHRQKIQKFQVQIVQEMKRSNSARSQEVDGGNLEAWEKAHHDLLTSQEANAYLQMGRSWEQILESLLLLYNYWKVNLKDDNIVFGDAGKSTGNDYFA